MKKTIIILLAAFTVIIAFYLYQKDQVNKKWADEKWRYFERIIVGNDLNEISPNHILRWKKNISISLEGKPTREDQETIDNLILQFNALLSSEKIQRSGLHPNVRIYFGDRSENDLTDKWPKYAYLKYDLTKHINPSIDHETYDYRNPYVINDARIYIRTDPSDQFLRNRLLLKGLADVLMGTRNVSPFRLSTEDSAVYLDYAGHQLNFPNYYPHFKNSIFNSYCNNCSQLADIDKYIIRTYYSEYINYFINHNSIKAYTKSYKTLLIISFCFLIALILVIYFSGYFQRTVFNTIDYWIKHKWISFNGKILFLFLVFCILLVTIITLDRFIYSKGIKFDLNIGSSPSFLEIRIYFIWAVYFFIPANFIYLVEKVCFPKFEQFAKRQVFSFLSLIAAMLFATYFLGKIIVPMHKGNYLIALYFGTGLALARFLFNYSSYQKKLAIKDKEQELTKLRELKTRAELNALQSKINPHFLYNALNSIAGLAHENADKTEQMALSLSKLFRYSINKEDKNFASVSEEIEVVNIYLDIEKIRFGNKFNYIIHVAEDIKNERMPKFILQPLAENAIKHGISKLTGEGLLKIDITKSDGYLKINMSDNGPDFPDDLITGYGLQNIYEKLDILYPNQYDVMLHNRPNKNITVLLHTEISTQIV